MNFSIRFFLSSATRNSAIADKPRDAFRGQSRSSSNILPYDSPSFLRSLELFNFTLLSACILSFTSNRRPINVYWWWWWWCIREALGLRRLDIGYERFKTLSKRIVFDYRPRRFMTYECWRGCNLFATHLWQWRSFCTHLKTFLFRRAQLYLA